MRAHTLQGERTLINGTKLPEKEKKKVKRRESGGVRTQRQIRNKMKDSGENKNWALHMWDLQHP